MNLFGAVERNRELLDRERAQAMQVEEERQRRYNLQLCARMGGGPRTHRSARYCGVAPLTPKAPTCWLSRRLPISSRWKKTCARCASFCACPSRK